MASRNVKNKKQNNHKMFSLFFFFLKKHSFYAASRNTVIFFILLILFSKTLHGDFPDWLPGNSFCFYFPKKLLFSLKKKHNHSLCSLGLSFNFIYFIFGNCFLAIKSTKKCFNDVSCRYYSIYLNEKKIINIFFFRW